MPGSPEATVLLHSLRIDGELLELPERNKRIEFIGDSLTSGEGALAARDNMEWVTPWFTSRGNYSWYACDALNAERSILSQSGWGCCWDYQHTEANNMSDAYEYTVGVLNGPEAEARGCRKPWDFSDWQPDIVCIRLLTNDNNGMIERRSFEEDREKVIAQLPDVTFIMKNGTEYPHKGRITSLTGVVNAITGSLSCKASFPNPDGHLYSGIQGTVVLPYAESGVIVIPLDAVVRLQDKSLVYMVKADSTATAIDVTTEDVGNGKDCIIRTGLNEGDKIVTIGANNVTEGQKVLF